MNDPIPVRVREILPWVTNFDENFDRTLTGTTRRSFVLFVFVSHVWRMNIDFVVRVPALGDVAMFLSNNVHQGLPGWIFIGELVPYCFENNSI